MVGKTRSEGAEENLERGVEGVVDTEGDSGGICDVLSFFSAMFWYYIMMFLECAPGSHLDPTQEDLCPLCICVTHYSPSLTHYLNVSAVLLMLVNLTPRDIVILLSLQ